MATQAEKEKARRFEIERAFVMPEPKHDWVPAAPSDRPSATVHNIVAAAQAKGWTVVEMSRYDWHPPKWVSVDGGPAEYRAAPRVQYGLFVHHPLQKMAPEGLAGVLINFVDVAKVGNIALGYGGENTWRHTLQAISSVAKLIREEGVPA